MKNVTKFIAITMLIACSSAVYYIKADDCDCLASKQCEGRKLTHCSLQGKNLAGGNFMNADLHGTNLSDTDFSHADLTGANLTNTVISNTNFSHAKLINAKWMYGTDPTTKAWIKSGNFSYADLRQTDYRNQGNVMDITKLFLPLARTGALTGTTWPYAWCPDNRCWTSSLNKNTVILSTINNKSKTDYVIATTNAPLNEIIEEIKSSKEKSPITTWLTKQRPLVSETPSVSHTFSSTTGKTYSFRFLGEYGDKPVIAKAQTVNQYPQGNNTFPDVSSDIFPTGTDAQTIILFPADLANGCRIVHFIGRIGSNNVFKVYTYLTYNEAAQCDKSITKDTIDWVDDDGRPGFTLQTTPSPLELGKGGKLSFEIDDQRGPASFTATAA